MIKLQVAEEGKDGWTEWIQPVRKGYKMGCCDCGLVHLLDFRLVKRKDGHGYIQFRASRLKERATPLRKRRP